MKDKTIEGYNSWTNYETWVVNLWIRNESQTINYWLEVTADCKRADPQHIEYGLSERLKNEITEDTPEMGASMYADLLGSALDNVNWREIAEHMIDDIESID